MLLFILQRFLAHDIGFAFQTGIVVDRFATHFHGWLHPSLALLYGVPGFMRQVLFLPGAEMDITALRVGMRIELRRFR